DRLAGGRLDHRVGVGELHPEQGRELPADRGLARAGRADHHRHRGHQRISRLSRYPARLRRISGTEAPPNFSVAASASTSATIASATTAPAGTAQTSERWLIAVVASPVTTSTVCSARLSDEIGFSAARTRSCSPLVMPPSRPPAR